MKKNVIVEGMKCSNCANHVKNTLISVEGITSAEVSLPDKHVLIESDIEVNDETIKLAINNDKYKVTGIETV